MKLNIKNTRDALQNFNFGPLFTEELGWSQPRNARAVPFTAGGLNYQRREIAQLAGVAVFEISAPGDVIPESSAQRREIQKEISTVAHENLLIFVGEKRTQSLWYWLKRENNKPAAREHYYFKGQPGDLFLSKLDAMVVDLSALSGDVSVTQVAERLKKALDVAPVTKKFFGEFKTNHIQFLNLIEGINDERDRRWYASVLLNRLMFIYFLQRKGFVDGGKQDYLRQKLAETQRQDGPNQYYEKFLKTLFFEGFAKPAEFRTQEVNDRLGDIVYLNGGLFLLHPVELRHPKIKIPDVAFENILNLFAAYSWNLDDTPGGEDNEINPDVLGYIFEKYINQKAFGAYYTRPEITDYLCRQTIHNLILEKINIPARPEAGLKGRHFNSVGDMLLKLDAPLCKELLLEVLPGLSLLDPACGSGAFLVAAMKTLIQIYTGLTGWLEHNPNKDNTLADWYRKSKADHASINYFIKKKIISDNLFGVDVMEEATEIARLRLFLALVASASRVEELEPLPNIDFNILAGNSLVGLLHVSESDFPDGYSATNMFRRPYHEMVAEKSAKVRAYRAASNYSRDLQDLRDDIQAHRDATLPDLNEILLDDFSKKLGIKYEQATWDAAANKEGKPTKRALKINDINELRPFHWGYEFDEVMDKRQGLNGFDAIITNPPWEVFQTDEKEFFQEYAPEIQKKKLRIEDWKTQQATLMQDTEIRQAWLNYASKFPYVSAYFKLAKQYENQRSVINGRNAGSKINLYNYFVEQCYNLLRPGGQCGIVIPSGIYTDLGTKQLRELLFAETEISGLFCFENRKEIFEGVDSRFKFVVLTFEKGKSTKQFPAAFMRHDVAELENFPAVGAMPMSVELIRQLSPASLSVMEFKNDLDVTIAQKMLRFPLLSEKISHKWNLSLTQEFNMTTDSHLFKTSDAPGRLPLYEGKMVHQFTHQWGQPKYWIDEKEARTAFLKKDKVDSSQLLPYQTYRLAYREIARNTDERTMIATILPKCVFANHKLMLSSDKSNIDNKQLLFCAGVMNSFAFDAQVRQRTTTGISMFTFYQLPVPRLSEGDAGFQPIVERAARLICTTPEFKELWEAVMPGVAWAVGAAGGPTTNETERSKLRAELDGMVAHLYGLNEAEFSHILATFPLVAEPVKAAALQAFRTLAPHPDDAQLAALIQAGENDYLEFKVAGYWNAKKVPPAKDDSMKENIVTAIAAFLNAAEGGALLIGVADDKSVPGLAGDYDAVNPVGSNGKKSKADRDRYELWLHDVLKAGLGGSWTEFYSISFHVIAGKEICRISVKPADKPVYTNNGSEMYARRGGRKEKLKANEIAPYVQKRWS